LAGPLRTPITTSRIANKETVDASSTQQNVISTASRSINEPDISKVVDQSQELEGEVHQNRRDLRDEDLAQQHQHTKAHPQQATGVADEVVATLVKETAARREAVAFDPVRDGQGGEQLDTYPTENYAGTSARGKGAQPQSPPSNVETKPDKISRELAVAEGGVVGAHLDIEPGREPEDPRIEAASSILDEGGGFARAGSGGNGGSKPVLRHASLDDDDGHIVGDTRRTTTPAATGELSSNADAEDGAPRQGSSTAAGADGTTTERREISSGQPCWGGRDDAMPLVQEGEDKPSAGDVAANAQKVNVKNSERPGRSSTTSVNSQRRPSERRNGLESGGAIETNGSDSGHESQPQSHGIDPTREAGGIEYSNKLLQSPPRLSRRRSSSGGLEPSVDLDEVGRPADELHVR